ncbi:MAG: GDP-L-fucose synthase [Gammaproteobacteria bacterium]|nr:GDP-L-fucose synthase [Gammaproteobacteria bacterium]MDH3414410.1 GDP-L-fucose synthase [Gammaproteobacteria bacterium]
MSEAINLERARVYVAGHRGLAGSAIHRALVSRGADHIINRSHEELDLTSQADVVNFFRAERPEVVFLCAAKVGGILANDTYPAEFLYSNLAIQNNVIHQAWSSKVRRLVFLGSSCIYPRECPQPMREEYLLTGPLEPTNRAYAIAKIAGLEACWSYNRQYGTEFVALMPTNMYGIGDNYHPENSHVFAALIRKAHEAKVAKKKSITVWGSGKPRREFLCSDDVAKAALMVAEMSSGALAAAFPADAPPMINVGAGVDISIRELIELVIEVVGYDGGIDWDASRPDGTPQKLLDISRVRALGWAPETTIRDGIALAYADYLEKINSKVA